MTPRPCVKRECSAVGKTQRALWSWLIRRIRWSQAVSSRSSSATSSSGSPAAADSSRARRLGQLHVTVDRVADEVDRGERLAAGHAAVVASRRPPVRGRHVVPQRRRREHLHVVAPRQDPQADLDRARHRRRPAERAVGLGLHGLGRVPGRLADAVGDGRREAQHDLGRRLVGDDVPRRAQRGRGRRRHRVARTSAASATPSRSARP